jgi:hypothetical protein
VSAPSTWPGRAIDRAVLVLALLALACATRIGEVPVDLSQAPAGEGVVLGSFEDVDAQGEPGWIYGLISPVFSVQVDESFGKPFEIALEGAISDFSALLPAGNYRWRSPCSSERVTFAVFPGEVTYIGTLRLQRGSALDCRVTFNDEYEATVARFRARHPALGASIDKHLMIRWGCDAEGCEPILAPDPR